jgi:large repetitive protein
VAIFDSPNNTVGGMADTAGNLISGNELDGIAIIGAASTGNRVQGNLIGTDLAGENALGNARDGVILTRGDTGDLTASNNTIGGTTEQERNIISGNGQDGVTIAGNSRAVGNIVQGNYIGTNQEGDKPLGNGRSGVRITVAIGFTDSASHNLIGGTDPGAGNLISGNAEGGVTIVGGQSGGTDNTVQANYIGTDATGTFVTDADSNSLGNLTGVKLDSGASSNVIGGTTAEAGNVISGNTLAVWIHGAGTTGNVVQGNRIGTNNDGAASLDDPSNFHIGVQISTPPDTGGPSGNTIGGTTAGAGNVIAGQKVGILFFDDVSNNLVEGNFIGTDSTGKLAKDANGNSFGNEDGMELNEGPSGNVIGGTTHP